MEMFDHVPVALFVAVQQGLGVAPVQCGEAGEAREAGRQPRQHPGPGEQRVVEGHQVGHRVTHGEPRASGLQVVSGPLPGGEENVKKDKVGWLGLPGILFVRDERGSVELQHGVLW